jgi:hypothetical protein
MGNLRKHKFDHMLWGIAAGILGACLGFLIFGMFIAAVQDVSFGRFIETLVEGTDTFHDKLVTVSILIDVVIFFIMIRKEYYEFCKGILAVVIVSVPVAVYLY